MSESSKQLLLLTAFSAAMVAMGLIWAGFETRLFQDHFVWLKPVKFAVSFVVLFGTLALAVRHLSGDVQNGRVLRITTLVLAAAFWFEMIYISVQAAQGQASHYNGSSVFHGVMYGIMGLGSLMLVAGTAVIGWLALRDTNANMGADLRFGVGVGFILSTVLTLITAATLSSMASHFVGTPMVGAPVIPIFGWSASVGDLRPAHFAALHAMQIIPLLAWWRQGRAGARTWVLGGAAAYSMLTLALFAQALMGLPLIRL